MDMATMPLSHTSSSLAMTRCTMQAPASAASARVASPRFEGVALANASRIANFAAPVSATVSLAVEVSESPHLAPPKLLPLRI
jgi:hypothetical protein